MIDADGSGELSKGEVGALMEQMGQKMTSMMGGTRELDAAFAEMDPNGDGSVSFDEINGAGAHNTSKQRLLPS